MALSVGSRQRDGRWRAVDREHGRVRHIGGERDGDRTAAAADVGDDGCCGALAQDRDRFRDERLGVRPWHEHAGPNRQVQAVELARARHVGQRLAPEPAGGECLSGCGVSLGRDVVEAGVELGAVDIERLHPQDVGLEPGVIDADRGEPACGVVEPDAEGAHASSWRSLACSSWRSASTMASIWPSRMESRPWTVRPMR